MPKIPAGVGVDIATGSASFIDVRGVPASAKLPDLDGATDEADINALLDLIGDASNAAMIDRRINKSLTVDLDTQAGALEAFDEAESSCNTVATMIFKRPGGKRQYLYIPAPDISILTADRQFVNVAAGQGLAIRDAVVAAMGAGAVYVGSYVTNHKGTKPSKVRVRPGAEEPAAGELPSGLPDVAQAEGVDTTPA